MTELAGVVQSDTTPQLAAALRLSAVTRSFAERRVLAPVTLTLDAGSLAVIAGPNGAGKTTLLRVAAGLLAPTSGTRWCAGRAVYLRPGAGARRGLTVRSALSHTAALGGNVDTDTDELCRLAGLARLAGRRVGELSSGQRARLAVALAVACAPVVACLDEPTAHVDADGVSAVRTLLRRLISEGTAMLVSTHAPGQLADLADATLTLVGGELRVVDC